MICLFLISALDNGRHKKANEHYSKYVTQIVFLCSSSR